MLNSQQELDAKREQCARSFSAAKRKILVCSGTGCIAAGSHAVYEAFLAQLEEMGLACAVELQKDPHQDVIGVKQSGCHGLCSNGAACAH